MQKEKPRKLRVVSDNGADLSGDRGSMGRRFWAKLGFGECVIPNWQPDPSFNRDYLVTTIRIQFSFVDRLRVLISGRIMVRTSTKTHPRVKRSQSKSAVSVLDPGQA